MDPQQETPARGTVEGTRFTFGSLFSGIGGMDLGLERAGLVCRWQVEIDPEARQALADHWPKIRRFEDAREFPPQSESFFFRHHPVDLVCGGDPCQENSGQRIASRASQASLGSEFLSIVDAIRPRFVLRENPSRVRPDAPWPWWKFANGLLALGYGVLPFRLRACCLGLGHRRERLFVLGSLPDPDGLEPQSNQRCGQALAAERIPEVARTQREWFRPESRSVLRDLRDSVLDRNPGKTDGIPARMDGRCLRGLGNALPPLMAEWIGRRLIEAAT